MANEPVSQPRTFQEELEAIAKSVTSKKLEKKLQTLNKDEMKQTANRTTLAFVSDVHHAQAIFSAADVLASSTSNHKVHILYHGEQESDCHDYVRNEYSFLPRKNPARYEYTAQIQTRSEMYESTERAPVFNATEKLKPKFIVVGLRRGLTPELLGSDSDISFRQLDDKCKGATPVICKSDYVFAQVRDLKTHEWKYESMTFAFQIDWSKDAEYAFDVMCEHFRNGDKVHLIWNKPDDREAHHGGRTSVLSLATAFHPFTKKVKELNQKNIKLNVTEHILKAPSVGKALVAFANDKKNRVNFLVCYMDLMTEYHQGRKLLGSVADAVVRNCNCPVIIPKLPLEN